MGSFDCSFGIRELLAILSAKDRQPLFLKRRETDQSTLGTVSQVVRLPKEIGIGIAGEARKDWMAAEKKRKK